MTEMSVVVPTHQRRDLLVRTLAALADQSVPPERYEVVVVCDGCTDDSGAAARDVPGLDLTVLEQERSGVAAARNRGVAGSRAPNLLILDDDMIARHDLLEVHLESLDRDPEALVMGAIPVHPDSPRSFLSVGLERWAERRHDRLACAGTEISPGDFLAGHLSLRRTTFDALGGFDESYTEGGRFGDEDLDFGSRARALGFPVVFEPRAVARQMWIKPFRDLARDIRESGRADVRLAAQHPEMKPHLTLGGIHSLSWSERRVWNLTRALPRASALGGGPLVACLHVADRLGWSGPFLERLHALARTYLYARGVSDAERRGR